MPIDAAETSANTSTAPSAAETGSAAPSQTETRAAPAQDAGVSADAASAQPTAGNRNPRAGSSANPNAIPQNAQPPKGELNSTAKSIAPRTTSGTLAPPAQPAAQPAKNWEEEAKLWQKRFSDTQQGSQREVARMQAELAELRQLREKQQAEAERLKLRQWSKQHPEHGKFQSTLQKASVIRQQLAAVPTNLPPEQQEAMKESILSAMAPEEQQLLQDYQQESQQFQRDFFIDPAGTIAPMVQQMIQGAFDQYRVHMQASQLIDKDFQELQPVIEAHKPELASMLQRGTPYDVAMENLRLKAQLGNLQNRVGEAEKIDGAAREQARLAKDRASITRDPVPTSKPDLYAMAKKEAEKLGISTDNPRFMGILSRLESNLRNTTPP